MTATLSAERVGELVHWLWHPNPKYFSITIRDNIRRDIETILSSYSSLRAEVERLREWSKKLEASHASLEERFRKAEAQLALAKSDAVTFKGCWDAACDDIGKLQAQLEKQAPLVNALLRIANEAFPSEATEKCMRSIARAALKLREEGK